MLYHYNIVFLVCQNGNGQGGSLVEIRGKVVSVSGKEPIPGAAVLLQESGKSTITDEKGVFEFKNLPAGSYKIFVSHLAYLPFEKVVSVNSGTHTENIFLVEGIKEMDEIVVSGGFFSTREETPFKIESISGANLQKSGNHNLMNALSSVPGVNAISYGPGIGKPVIRGLSFSRIMTIYQGIRFENQQWGEEHGLGLNDLGIDRIEIIKGPASVLYGSGALGGVINIIDEKPVLEGIKGDFLLQGFSNTLGLKSNLGLRGGNGNGLFYSVRGNLESHTDYSDGNGRIIGNSRFKNAMFKAKTGLQKNWGSSTITYTFNKQLLGIIEEDEMDHSLATDKTDRKIIIPYQDVTDHLFTLQNQFKLKEFNSIRFNLSHHVNFREENEESFDLVDLGLILNTSTYDLRYNFLPTPNTEVVMGLQGFRQSNQNMKGTQETLLPNAVRYDNSVLAWFHKMLIE